VAGAEHSLALARSATFRFPVAAGRFFRKVAIICLKKAGEMSPADNDLIKTNSCFSIKSKAGAVR
jgi:hypothetical protein